VTKALISLALLCGVGLLVWLAKRLRAQTKTHDAIEYYRGWYGYHHPIYLKDRITKEAADALAAAGKVYLIANFDADGRLTHVVKMLRGAVFFEFVYAYHASGKIKSVKATNSNGVVTERDYDGSQRAGFFW